MVEATPLSGPLANAARHLVLEAIVLCLSRSKALVVTLPYGKALHPEALRPSLDSCNKDAGRPVSYLHLTLPTHAYP